MSRLLAVLVVIALSGCTGVKPPIEGRADPYVPAQVHFDSDQLRRDTAVGQPIVSRDEFGLLHVTVPIRSAVDLTLYVDYRVTFFDRQGRPVERFGPFTKTLDPRTPDAVTVNSTKPDAADFQIDFRYAR